jgi:hypothetical protein
MVTDSINSQTRIMSENPELLLFFAGDPRLLNEKLRDSPPIQIRQILFRNLSLHALFFADRTKPFPTLL